MICWIIEKAREFQKNICFCFVDYAKAFYCVDHNKLWKILNETGTPDYLICLLRNLKKQQNSRKTSTSASLTMLKPLTVWITTNWKILQEMGIPDHLTCLTCLPRNLYAGQEATVRTGHGTTNWFQIGKGVCKGCILSPCLFNLNAEYIMQNARMDETQDGIKTASKNINNLICR